MLHACTTTNFMASWKQNKIIKTNKHKPASQHASQQESQPASQHANKQASQPTSKQASQPANTQESQPDMKNIASRYEEYKNLSQKKESIC